MASVVLAALRLEQGVSPSSSLILPLLQKAVPERNLRLYLFRPLVAPC
jgi:hypothetical protein